jgi:pyruvate carboxylase subunit B
VKYIVDIDGERMEVHLDADGVRVDGELVHAHIADVEGTPIRLLTVGSELHRVAVRRGDVRGRYSLWMNGRRYEVEALDERTRSIRDLTAAAATASGPRPLVAPMPGLIVRVNVRVGDVVEAGQGLVVMEAMKMENELRSASAGTVKAILALAGTAVEKGAVVVELS